MATTPQFIMKRQFKAPLPNLWRAWTDPELLAQWYGPNCETIIHELDVRPGGVWRNEMKFQNGNSNFEIMRYAEVTPQEKLVWDHSVTDANWKVIDNPMMENWPRVLLTEVTFASDGEGSAVTLVWTPKNATQAEEAAFAASMQGLEFGWGAGFDKIAELLAGG